ncbi:MAG: ComEC/Rec2 family competence protein [Candidatus Dormibacteria bacterium]
MSDRSPSTTPALIATSILAAFAVALTATVAAQPPRPLAFGTASVIAGAAITGAALHGGRRAAVVAGILIAAGLGLVRGALAVQAYGPEYLGAHLGAAPVSLLGTVRDGVAGRAHQLIVDSSRLVTGDEDAALSGGVLVSLPPAAVAPAPGESVRVDARGLRPPGRRPGPRSAEALDRIGVDAVAVSPSVIRLGGTDAALHRGLVWVRQQLTAGIDAVLPEPAATLMLGIAFGLRRPLAADVAAPLQDSGLFHIVVVSGLKVIIVAGMVRAVARVRGWSRGRYAFVALTTVTSYVLVSGAGPAAVRSAVMAGIAMLGGRGGRRADPIPVLALTAAVMLAIDPRLSGDVGFQLSFIGTAGILLLADPVSSRLPGPRIVAEPFAVTVAAQMATFPVMAGTFGVLSLIGPVANALVLPVLPALIVLGGAGAAAASILPTAGWLPLHLAGAGVDGIMLVASVTSSLPGAAIHVGEWPPLWTMAEIAGLFAGSAALAPTVIRRRRQSRATSHTLVPDAGASSDLRIVVGGALASALLAGGIVLMIGGRPDGRLHVTVLDVGAAPGMVIRTGEGAIALVDGGADPKRLLTALGRNLTPTSHRIDMVIMTSGERSAVGGLPALADHYQVDHVAAPARLPAGAPTILAGLHRSGATVEQLDGRSWAWRGVMWSCLTVGEDSSTSGQSCVLSVSSEDDRALLLGTASVTDQEQLAARHGAGELSAGLLVTPPGGALAPSLLGLVMPRWLAVPTAASSAPPRSDSPVRTEQTGVDGDLVYDGTRGGFRHRGEGG